MDEQKFVKTIDDFLNMVQKRETKVKEHINRLERQINDIKSDIKAFTTNIVECELSDDIKGAKKAKGTLKTLQTELTETIDMLEAYQSQLDRSTGYEREIEKIKLAALKLQENRDKKLAALRNDKKRIEQKMMELKQKTEQIDKEIDFTNLKREYIHLSKIMQFIHPKANKVSYHDKESFIKAWLRDEDIEHFFKEPSPSRGLTVTYGPGDLNR